MARMSPCTATFVGCRQCMSGFAHDSSYWPSEQTLLFRAGMIGCLGRVRSVACVYPKSNLEIPRVRLDPRLLKVEKNAPRQGVSHGREVGHLAKTVVPQEDCPSKERLFFLQGSIVTYLDFWQLISRKGASHGQLESGCIDMSRAMAYAILA